jgi:hypothetical protein
MNWTWLILQGSDLVVGNLGDSRAIMATRDAANNLTAVQLTVDLKPNLPSMFISLTDNFNWFLSFQFLFVCVCMLLFSFLPVCLYQNLWLLLFLLQIDHFLLVLLIFILLLFSFRGSC